MASVVGSFLLRFFGNTVSTAAGFAFGSASHVALIPAVRAIESSMWEAYPDKPPDAMTMAMGVAQGQVDPTQAAAWAKQNGFAQNVFNALVDVANVGMPLGNAFDAWRRGLLSDADFDTQLKRVGMESQWYTAMQGLKDQLLTPQELAVMVQRGIVANDGLLPVGPPTATGRVPPMPQINIDPVQEAAKLGWSQERLAGLARIVGLPASPDLAARMVFRGIIDQVDFERAISEGNTRNEWAPFLFEGFREIPTARDFVQLHLRGWTDATGMYAGTARHGYSPTDTDVLYQISRRPLTVRAITTALARGGVFQPQPGGLTDPYEAAVHQANLGPEWYDLAIANRYTYPSAFVLRSMAQAGELGNVAAVEQVLLEIGWKPQFAAQVAQAWAPTGTVADPNAKKAESQLWTRTHSSYTKQEIGATDARSRLSQLGIDPASQDAILALWDSERSMIHAQLSPAQIHKAYKEQVTNPATGQPWTLQDATTGLLERGYSQADAQVLLSE